MLRPGSALSCSSSHEHAPTHPNSNPKFGPWRLCLSWKGQRHLSAGMCALAPALTTLYMHSSSQDRRHLPAGVRGRRRRGGCLWRGLLCPQPLLRQDGARHQPGGGGRRPGGHVLPWRPARRPARVLLFQGARALRTPMGGQRRQRRLTATALGLNGAARDCFHFGSKERLVRSAYMCFTVLLSILYVLHCTAEHALCAALLSILSPQWLTPAPAPRPRQPAPLSGHPPPQRPPGWR